MRRLLEQGADCWIDRGFKIKERLAQHAGGEFGSGFAGSIHGSLERAALGRKVLDTPGRQISYLGSL